MHVYFELPRCNPLCPMEFIFPNSNDIPMSYSGDEQVASWRRDPDFYRHLQKDLMDLAKNVYEFLNALPLAVNGRALMYYRSQSLRTKREYKKANLPDRMYTFGVAIRTDYGESDFYCMLKKEGDVIFYVSGMGIAEKVIREVVAPFAWKSECAVGIVHSSRYRGIVERSSPASRWYGYYGRAFNIPAEDLIATV